MWGVVFLGILLVHEAFAGRFSVHDFCQGDSPQSVGYYTDGSLDRACFLPQWGDGFIKVFRPLGRHWGHRELVMAIRRVAHYIQHEFPGRSPMMVGDLSAYRGGPILDFHVSHQNGLDVDIAYFRLDDSLQEPNIIEDYELDIVDVPEAFDVPRNWALVQAFAREVPVARMFVHRQIKRRFCEALAREGRLSLPEVQHTLSLIQPYSGHSGHIHIRLRCPHGEPRCRDQAPLRLERLCP